MRFRYDPFGDLALSAQGATTDFGSGLYGYQMKSQSSVILDGQVHVMHLTTGQNSSFAVRHTI